MTLPDPFSLVADLVSIIGMCVAIYAIRDTRALARNAIFLERNRVYARVRNDMAWLYIDPTGSGHTSEIAKQLEEFCNLAQALDPAWEIGDIKFAVEREALQYADTLVATGVGAWKPDIKPDGVAQALKEWQSDKSRERIKKILGDYNFLM
jgi:hypothetical protein